MVWIADVLPNEIAPYIDGQMDLGALAMQKRSGELSSVMPRDLARRLSR